MPFVPLSPEDHQKFPEPCRSREHDPPTHLVIVRRVKWVCPECGTSVILEPSAVRTGCSPVSKPSGPRTRSQVMEARRTGPGGSG